MKLTVPVPRPAALTAWLLVTFLVLFPKGGIKMGSTPLTWGYLFLGVLFVPLLLVRTLKFPLRFSQLALTALGVSVPFQLLFVYSCLRNGVLNLGYALAIGIAFIFLPWVFLLLFPAFLPFVRVRSFVRQFRFCILAAAIWGIFLFFYHPLRGKYIEIPYLTVNAGDYGLLETTKHIDRGGYLKLISTYNNGNLYGVATLILLPLYLLLEPALWKRNVVRIALVLTLSRTVWAGLILEQGMSFAWRLPSFAANFPRIRPGRVMRQGIALVATAALVLTGLLFNGNGLGFLFSKDLGGRGGELVSFHDPTLLPSVPVTSFNEVLYASALELYGVLGFLAILLIFFSPLLLAAWKPHLLTSPVRRAAVKGLMLYAVVAIIDGATILIPVMAFYWFTYMTMIFGLPGEQAVPVKALGVPQAGVVPAS